MTVSVSEIDKKYEISQTAFSFLKKRKENKYDV